MTPTPHLQAAAMRARAAERFPDGRQPWPPRNIRAAILALPLEATPAELLAEAVKLPEVVALIEAAIGISDWSTHSAFDEIKSALQPFIALETP